METTPLWGRRNPRLLCSNASLKGKPQKGREYVHVVYLIKVKDLDPERIGEAITRFLKWARDKNRTSTQEGIQMTDNHLKRCLITSAPGHRETKSTVRCHRPPHGRTSPGSAPLQRRGTLTQHRRGRPISGLLVNFFPFLVTVGKIT